MTKKILFFCLGISLLSFIGHLFVYPTLPEVITTHWNAVGEPNGFSGKYMALVLAGLPFALLLLFEFLPQIDPKRESYTRHKTAYSIFVLAIILLLIVVSWATTLNAMGILVPVEIIVPIAVGGLFIVMGIYLPQAKSNYTFGIRTPWTLESSLVWDKTHKLGGILFMIGGVLMAASAVFRGNMWIWVVMIYTFVMVAILFTYSYLIFRKNGKAGK